jgi:hypothetical protein
MICDPDSRRAMVYLRTLVARRFCRAVRAAAATIARSSLASFRSWARVSKPPRRLPRRQPPIWPRTPRETERERWSGSSRRWRSRNPTTGLPIFERWASAEVSRRSDRWPLRMPRCAPPVRLGPYQGNLHDTYQSRWVADHHIISSPDKIAKSRDRQIKR